MVEVALSRPAPEMESHAGPEGSRRCQGQTLALFGDARAPKRVGTGNTRRLVGQPLRCIDDVRNIR